MKTLSRPFLQLLKCNFTLPGLLMCAFILPDHSVSFTLNVYFRCLPTDTESHNDTDPLRTQSSAAVVK